MRRRHVGWPLGLFNWPIHSTSPYCRTGSNGPQLGGGGGGDGQPVALYWLRTHSGDWLLKLELSSLGRAGFEPTSDILYMLRRMLSRKLTLLVRHHTVKAKGERGGKVVRCLNTGSEEATVVLRISETIKARKTSNCQDWRKSVV